MVTFLPYFLIQFSKSDAHSGFILNESLFSFVKNLFILEFSCCVSKLIKIFTYNQNHVCNSTTKDQFMCNVPEMLDMNYYLPRFQLQRCLCDTIASTANELEKSIFISIREDVTVTHSYSLKVSVSHYTVRHFQVILKQSSCSCQRDDILNAIFFFSFLRKATIFIYSFQSLSRDQFSAPCGFTSQTNTMLDNLYIKKTIQMVTNSSENFPNSYWTLTAPQYYVQ